MSRRCRGRGRDEDYSPPTGSREAVAGISTIAAVSCSLYCIPGGKFSIPRLSREVIALTHDDMHVAVVAIDKCGAQRREVCGVNLVLIRLRWRSSSACPFVDTIETSVRLAEESYPNLTVALIQGRHRQLFSAFRPPLLMAHVASWLDWQARTSDILSCFFARISLLGGRVLWRFRWNSSHRILDMLAGLREYKEVDFGSYVRFADIQFGQAWCTWPITR